MISLAQRCMSGLSGFIACLRALSLFSGAGGLDLGLEAAGFEIAGCVERDSDSRATLQRNTRWSIADNGDVEQVTPQAQLAGFGMTPGELALLAGGPPCQPFSKSGQWRTGRTARMADPRAKTMHAYFDYVDAAIPKVMVLENVKGLVSKPRPGSNGAEVLDFVAEALAQINTRHGTSYVPTIVHMDAADYGAPQKRERVFVVADRDGCVFEKPAATHSLTPESGLARYATAWDAIGDLDSDTWDDSLNPTGAWAGLLASIPEGKNYLHHTDRGAGQPLFGWRTKYWSFLLKLSKERPSWTIQAQPGPATGPFHWRSRKLSVREMARIQTFPDAHIFAGSYSSARRQIGNAVPVVLAEALGNAISVQLMGNRSKRRLSASVPVRPGCPPPETPGPVPASFAALAADHAAHPGEGLGPGVRG